MGIKRNLEEWAAWSGFAGSRAGSGSAGAGAV